MKKNPRPPRPRNGSTGDAAKPGRIICGDALIELPLMALGSVQLVIADPP
jgi:hypothetical protein